MKKILLLILIISSTATVTAQKLKGNKNVITQTRSLDDFTMIDVYNDIDVYFLNSNKKEVKVETDENLQNTVNTSVKNGILSINLNNKISRKKALKVFISTTTDIYTINANDNVNLHATNNIGT